MKFLIIPSLILTLSVSAQTNLNDSQGTGYAPGHGSQTGQGTFTTPHAGFGQSAPSTTTRGTDINGAETLGTSEYPNSGMSGRHTSDLTGNDAASGTYQGKEAKKPVANRNFDRALDQGSTQTGPFETTNSKQAQEESENRMDPSPSEQKRKQQGY